MSYLLTSPACPRSPFRSREPRVSKFPSGVTRARKVSTRVPLPSSPSPSTPSSSSFSRVDATGREDSSGSSTSCNYLPSGVTGAAPVVATLKSCNGDIRETDVSRTHTSTRATERSSGRVRETARSASHRLSGTPRVPIHLSPSSPSRGRRRVRRLSDRGAPTWSARQGEIDLRQLYNSNNFLPPPRAAFSRVDTLTASDSEITQVRRYLGFSSVP